MELEQMGLEKQLGYLDGLMRGYFFPGSAHPNLEKIFQCRRGI